MDNNNTWDFTITDGSMASIGEIFDMNLVPKKRGRPPKNTVSFDSEDSQSDLEELYVTEELLKTFIPPGTMATPTPAAAIDPPPNIQKERHTESPVTEKIRQAPPTTPVTPPTTPAGDPPVYLHYRTEEETEELFGKYYLLGVLSGGLFVVGAYLLYRSMGVASSAVTPAPVPVPRPRLPPPPAYVPPHY